MPEQYLTWASGRTYICIFHLLGRAEWSGEGSPSPGPPAPPQLLHLLMTMMMPMAHRTPAQMSPPTWRLCQSRRKVEGTSVPGYVLSIRPPILLTNTYGASRMRRVPGTPP